MVSTPSLFFEGVATVEPTPRPYPGVGVALWGRLFRLSARGTGPISPQVHVTSVNRSRGATSVAEQFLYVPAAASSDVNTTSCRRPDPVC